MIQILDSQDTPERLMQKDRELLRHCTEPTLHFYRFTTPSATFGLLTKLEDYLYPSETITCAQRPTGGGILFHLTDFTFSILLPKPFFSANILENYHMIHSWTQEALTPLLPSSKQLRLLSIPQDNSLRFCMAQPTQYDILLDGKKLVGAAQRKTHRALLHQASLNIYAPPFEELAPLFKNPEVLPQMKKHTACLLDAPVSYEIREYVKNSIREVFVKKTR